MTEAVGDMRARHRAVAGIGRGVELLYLAHDRLHDLHRVFVCLLAHRIGAIVPRAALDGLDLGAGDQREHVACLQTDVLHPLVTGHLVGHLAETVRELGVQQAGLVAMHQVFEGIVDVLLHGLHIGIVGEHQRQFLLEHQDAGRDRRDDVPAGADRFDQNRDVVFLQRGDAVEITEFELWHATAFFAADEFGRDAVVFEHPHQVLAHLGCVVGAVTGSEHRDLAARRTRGLRFLGAGLVIPEALPEVIALVLRHLGQVVNAKRRFEALAHKAKLVCRVHGYIDQRNAGEAPERGGGGEDLVTQAGAFAAELDGLGAQHQVRIVDRPLVGWHVGAFRLVTQVAEVAMVHHVLVLALVGALEFEGG